MHRSSFPTGELHTGSKHVCIHHGWMNTHTHTKNASATERENKRRGKDNVPLVSLPLSPLLCQCLMGHSIRGGTQLEESTALGPDAGGGSRRGDDLLRDMRVSRRGPWRWRGGRAELYYISISDQSACPLVIMGGWALGASDWTRRPWTRLYGVLLSHSLSHTHTHTHLLSQV